MKPLRLILAVCCYIVSAVAGLWTAWYACLAFLVFTVTPDGTAVADGHGQKFVPQSIFHPYHSTGYFTELVQGIVVAIGAAVAIGLFLLAKRLTAQQSPNK